MSLLNLNLRKISDPYLIDSFNDVKNRIWTIALIHEKMYGSGSFSSIDFPEYINSLASGLIRTYLKTVPDVVFGMDAGKVAISIEKAIPCSLITNEIISNSLKHAFPQGWKGKPELTVSVHENRDGMVELIIRDNGIGMIPRAESAEANSLGLTLIKMLTKQIGGAYRVDGDNGTRYTVTFKNR